MFEKIGFLVVVDAYVEIVKGAGEEVVDFSGYVEYVTNAKE